jgi:glycosyltransferase involved in cell wall biosynthesis
MSHSPVTQLDYFTTAPPWPLDSGARLRVGAIYDALLHHDIDVRLIVLGEKPDRETRRRLGRVEGLVYPSRSEALPQKLRRYLMGVVSGHDPIAAQFFNARRIARLGRLVAERGSDAVLLGNIYLSPLLPTIRVLAPRARIIVDNHNVESLLHRRLALHCQRLRLRLPAAVVAHTTARLEREHLPRADQVWACSETDAGYLRRAYRLPRVHVIPNGVDTHAFNDPAGVEQTSIVFTGSFFYAPNEQAALALMALSERLRCQGLRHTLCLVGLAPTPAMRTLALRSPHIVVTGAVPDVRPYLAQAGVFAAPLRAGSGTKLKLLQAMAMGKAIVTTRIGAEGLRLTDGVDALISDEPAAFEAQLARLLRSPEERLRLGSAARRHVVRHFSLDAIDRTLGEALRELLGAAAA